MTMEHWTSRINVEQECFSRSLSGMAAAVAAVVTWLVVRSHTHGRYDR